MRRIPERLLVVIAIAMFLPSIGWLSTVDGQEHALVIRGGRVIDPETRLDGLRHLGIDDGRITAISVEELSGRETIDASGLIVAPGFIDLHQHAWDAESMDLKARDGVTSVFELEVGTADVAGWLREREGATRVNFGVSVGHIPVRMAVMGDPPGFLPASNSGAATITANQDQIVSMAEMLEEGLDAGAVAVGFGIAYTPAATDDEIVRMFEVAARRSASCHVHLRGGGQGTGRAGSAIQTAEMAAKAGAPLCFVHYQAGAKDEMPALIRWLEIWRANGQDVSAEVYPWNAGMTDIKAAMFGEGFQQRMGIDYGDLQWGATGERLTRESFERFRKEGGLVIVFNNTDAAVDLAIAHPDLMIASDGLRGHPRNAGTFSKVLERYVRELEILDWMTAIRKMTLLPAQRLEACSPQMRRKGRIQVGCDADLTLFDPNEVEPRATYQEPFLPSHGIAWVLVAGTPVVKQGQIVPAVFPGQPIRGGGP